MNDQSPTVNDPVATREFECVSPEGERWFCTVSVGRPTRVSAETNSGWRCPIALPLEDSTPAVFGDDSWQALSLAMSFVHLRLADFIQRGGKLYYPGCSAELTIADFPHFLTNG